MTIRSLLLLALLLPGVAAAAEAPVIFKRYQISTVLEANGQAVQTTSLEARATTDAGARQISQQSVAYVEGMESPELIEATIRKSDGRVITLQREAARLIGEPSVANAPAYDDHKRLTVLLPEFAAGDSLSITVRKRIQQPVFRGNFALSAVFSRLIEWQNADISLSVPASMAIIADATGVTGDSRVEGDRRLLRWHHSAAAVPEDHALLSPLDRVPRVFASTFADWPAFGRAWAALALPKANVTDAVRQRAASITEGITDKREQAQAIYAWVQKSVRWVAVPLGSGSFEPASADTVLARGYADGKDMAILMVALLKARDIAADLMLINNTYSFTVPKAPNYISFNHVIVFLPEMSVYADPVAKGTPFGSLPFTGYGKTVLRIGAGGASLEQIAPLAERQAVERVRTTMTLDAAGNVQGDSINEAIGPFAGDLRRVAMALRAAGPRGAALQLHALGYDGTGSFAGPDPVDVSPAFGVKSHFELVRQPGWLDGSPFAMPGGMRLIHRPGDVLLGALAAIDVPASEPTPCFAGQQEEEVTLALPPGNHIARQPKDLKIDTDTFSYASTWTVTQASVKVYRVLQTRIAASLCTGQIRADAADALPRIRRDLNTQIWLEAN